MEKRWLRHYESGVPALLEIPRQSLPETLRETARRFAGHTSMTYLGSRWTYRELDELVDRAAQLLRSRGIRPGDRVGIDLPNCPQFVVAYFAILRAGAVAVPINPLFSGTDLTFVIRDSGMTAAFVSLELLPVLRAAGAEGLTLLLTDVRSRLSPEREVAPEPGTVPLEKALLAPPASDPSVPVSADAIANLQYTGGTTGRSKGAILTHRNLLANALQFRHWFRNVFEDGEGRFVCVIPLFHIYGLTTSMIGAVVGGGSMLLLPRFDLGELMSLIEEERPSLFMGVPAMYGAIVAREGPRRDLRSIRACVSGSAPLPPAVQAEFERLTGGKLVEGYGLTEASPVVTVNPIRGRVKIGTIGVPIIDTDIRVVDPETGTELVAPGEVGELLVKGPQVMRGYWNQPEETALVLEDGWLRTGDLVRVDEDGYVTIADRLKDMIIVGGEKVYPREVEDLLYTHPAVREAAVVGFPHPLRGEVPRAFVALKEGAAVSEREVRDYCAARLSRFKVPHQVEFMEALPRNSVGKVLRRLLREGKR